MTLSKRRGDRGVFRRAAFLPAVLVMTAAAVGCGQSPITPVRIENAIEPTFGNLVRLQISWLGLPPIAAPDSGATASCRKLTGGKTGAGEWVCNVAWLGPDRQTLRDRYELFVGTDGCYTATVEGKSLGGPRLKTSDGRDVRNLLFAFEGCFDTT